MWSFAVLLVVAVGMFPLQAILGQDASVVAWRSVAHRSMPVTFPRDRVVRTIHRVLNLRIESVDLITEDDSRSRRGFRN